MSRVILQLTNQFPIKCSLLLSDIFTSKPLQYKSTMYVELYATVSYVIVDSKNSAWIEWSCVCESIATCQIKQLCVEFELEIRSWNGVNGSAQRLHIELRTENTCCSSALKPSPVCCPRSSFSFRRPFPPFLLLFLPQPVAMCTRQLAVVCLVVVKVHVCVFFLLIYVWLI